MRSKLIATLCVGLCTTECLYAADWPAWRHDAARTAVTDESLAGQLHLAWWRQLAPNHIAWPEDTRLQFDAAIQPIVIDGMMLVASSQNHSVMAFNLATGEQQWQFFADGPIRLAPMALESRVYFGADDGLFYCVEAANGELVWKLNAAPSRRMVLGNERLISVWPIRGGPVVGNGEVHFTAGVWPFEGTLLYTVDLHRSHGDVPRYRVTALNNVAPQGHLVLNSNHLFIPGSRSKATCFDLESRKILDLNYRPSGFSDYHVTSTSDLLFDDSKVYDMRHERLMLHLAHRPISDGAMLYCAKQVLLEKQETASTEPEEDNPLVAHKLVAFDLSRRETFTTKDRKGEEVLRDRVPIAWELSADQIVDSTEPLKVFLKAGARLYGSCGNSVFALDLRDSGDKPRVSWKAQIEGEPASMLAADGRLIIATREGRIYCFSSQSTEPKTYPRTQKKLIRQPQAARQKVASILRMVEDPEGYCLVLGIGSGEVIAEILHQSTMKVIVLDRNSRLVQQLRKSYDAQGIYGDRITALVGDLNDFRLPPYLASLIVSSELSLADSAEIVANAYDVLRPYGGVLALDTSNQSFRHLAERIEKLELPNAKLSQTDGITFVEREGALVGAAEWTHEYGNAANTLMSWDSRVRAPLGVLWFGSAASSGELYFDRHFWGPGATVVDGRMLVQGPQLLTSVDVYTGRVLWKRRLREGSGPGRRGNFFDVLKPGFHTVAVKDSVYLAYPDACLRLDPKTGETLAEFQFPLDLEWGTMHGQGFQWGKIRVWKDQLIVSIFRGPVPTGVAAVDRYSGAINWIKEATLTFPLVAVGSDKVFLFDGIMIGLYDAWTRKGRVPRSSSERFVKAIDIRTGDELWQHPSELVATWLAFSEKHDVVIVANKDAIAALAGEDGKSLWKKNNQEVGFGGHPENAWDKFILAGDLVIDQRAGRAFDLRTGEPSLERHPMTGQEIPWQFTRSGHHCNYAIANPHLVTFRAKSAGFYDRHSKGTARLAGFRSGCRNSLIPACGVLNAPNYAHGCRCNYSMFTSLALVHVPDAELWTYNTYKTPEQNAARRFGVNFGAPGSRLSDRGTLWTEYPHGEDPSARVAIEVEGNSLQWFRQHSSHVTGTDLRWVGASGVEGLSNLAIEIPGSEKTDATYTVRLFFSEPNEIATGERVFDVSLQGETVLEGIDVVQVAGKHRKLIEKSFPGVRAKGEIRLNFSAVRGVPLINGVEMIRD